MTPRLGAAVLTALLLAGCGGGGAGGEAEEIGELARTVVTSAPGAARCEAWFTPEFVTTVYGDAETCARVGAAADPADTASGVSVADLTVDGDSATAAVTAQGGSADGARGIWVFARSEGEWRVAEWRTDYLRSIFRAQFGPAYTVAGDDDPFRDPEVRACISAAFQSLADPEFRATAHEILRDSRAADDAVRRWYFGCVDGEGRTEEGGVSELRRIFEEGLRGADVPREVVDCAIRRLRTTVTDDEIRRMGAGGAPAPPPGVQRRINAATTVCVEQLTER